MSDELSNDARALLDAARHEGGPSRTQRARLTVAVMTATGGTAAAMTGAAVATGSTLKLVVAGVLAAAVGVGGTVGVKRALVASSAPEVARSAAASTGPVEPSHESASAPAVVLEPSTTPVEPTLEPEVAPAIVHRPHEAQPASPTIVQTKVADDNAARVEPAVVSAADDALVERSSDRSQSVPVAEPARADARPLDNSAAAEVTALGAALEALEAHDAEQARVLARQARLQFPNGTLRPELTLIEIEALCLLNRDAEAVELMNAMPAADRTPLVLEKLRNTCVMK